MALSGFDPRWQDFPDYIIGITHEIWEERHIERLHRYYAADIPVRSPGSVVIGNQAVIAATIATLAEFPDRTLMGEDVIWSGTPEQGLLSSHRLFSTATHLGDGVYGRASGKALRYRIIADCHAINNQINDEWLIRDQGAIVRQLGMEPKAYAADLIDREGGPEHCVQPLTPATDVAGPYQGPGNDNPWGERYADLITRIMAGELAVVTEQYDRAVQIELPGGISDNGRAAVDRFWLGLRASFPSAQFSVEHRIGREDPLFPPRAALRWSLYGKHEGTGLFGAPSGAMIYVLGASHAEFGPWGLRREFILYDEIAIWKQMLLSSG